MNSDLSLDFLTVVEQAAIACAHTMGQGDRHRSDLVAVEAMRRSMDAVPMNGTVVIGEGERDEAPMLFIGEKVAKAQHDSGSYPEIDIAVDPLEGTNFTAKNLPNALSVLAVTRRGNLLHAPDIYMEKIAIGPNLPKNIVDLDFSVKENIELLNSC